MPLRDHFRAPLQQRSSWDLVHGMWPAMMVLQLNTRLPAQYVAGPMVHLGSEIEVDVAAFENDLRDPEFADGDGLWRAAAQTMVVETELLTIDEYELRIFDRHPNRRLVAVVEIVSPSNKDRPESRLAFTAKCRSLLRKGVSVTIVDIVTTKHFNLYAELLDFVGVTDPTVAVDPPATYAAACRWVPRGRKHVLETWTYPLVLGGALPTVPLWLTENFAVPLELEETYEQTCRALRILD